MHGLFNIGYTRPKEFLNNNKKTEPVPVMLAVFDACIGTIAASDRCSSALKLKGRALMKSVDGKKNEVHPLEFMVWSSTAMRGSIPLKTPVIIKEAAYKQGEFYEFFAKQKTLEG